MQAKRWTWKVGVKAVQEAVAGAVYYGCAEKMVVTTSYFTKEAIQMAERTETQLWGVRELAGAMGEANGQAVDGAEQGWDAGAPTCPQCGAEMRSSDKGGKEWSVCSRYPACQGYRRK